MATDLQTAPPAPASSDTTPTAASPPATAPATPAAPAPDKGLEDAWAAQEARLNTPPTPAKPAATDDKKGDAPARPAGDKPAKGAAQKPATDHPAGPNKELRQQYETTKAELDQKLSEIQQLQARIKDAESKGKDVEALTTRLADRDKEYEKLLAEHHAAKFETSKDFKQHYEEPFNHAAEDAKVEIESLMVGKWGVSEEGEKTWTGERQAKWDTDFAQLYTLPYIEAKRRARDLFGEDSELVMGHYNNLHRMTRDKERALDRERGEFKERQNKETAAQATLRQNAGIAFEKVTQDAVARNELFREDPKDEAGNQLLKEGFALVDHAMRNRASLSMQERIISDANIRLRAAAFPRLSHRINSLKTENEALKAQIEELKSNGPGRTKRPAGDTSGAPSDDVETWKGEARKAING